MKSSFEILSLPARVTAKTTLEVGKRCLAAGQILVSGTPEIAQPETVQLESTSQANRMAQSSSEILQGEMIDADFVDLTAGNTLGILIDEGPMLKVQCWERDPDATIEELKATLLY